MNPSELVMSRWWLVGCCAYSFLVLGIHKSELNNSDVRKVASSTYNIKQVHGIEADIYLIAVFHIWFLFLIFTWCILGDTAVGNTFTY